MKKEYIEKIYAGWLAKVIGVRYGAPVESWTYEKIKSFMEHWMTIRRITNYLRQMTTQTGRSFSFAAWRIPDIIRMKERISVPRMSPTLY